jgi:predicted RNase H-like nuclease (RuvC/YqgF family)
MPEVKRIPADISGVQKAIADARARKAAGSHATPNDRRAATEAQEAKKRARDAENARKDLATQLEEAKAEAAAAKAEAEEAKKKADELTPLADSYRKHEHTERHKLLADLPAELQKEAKDFPLAQLKSFHKLATGGGTATTPKTGGGSGKDWLALLAGDEAAFDKAMKDDPKGWTEFTESQKKQ